MKPTHNSPIRLIAAFKLFKAMLLIGVGVGALKLIHTDVSSLLEKWVTHFGLDPGSRYLGHLILTTATLTPNKIKDLAVGSFVYAALFLTEGIGLWMLKRWAGVFPVLLTSFLGPGGNFQDHRKPSFGKNLILVYKFGRGGILVYR